MRSEDVIIRELFWNNMIPLLFEKNASVRQIYSNFIITWFTAINIELLEVGRVKKFLVGLQDVLKLPPPPHYKVNGGLLKLSIAMA